jgi:2-polyprenyl-3-methyl-5-hydroxy-6-metoxy-1,4-benzoquinol methylase
MRECSPIAPEGYGGCVTRDDNRRGLSRAYSEETWRVYEFLDISLDPGGLDSLYEFAAPHLDNDSRILDAGCRDAKHLIELVRRYGGTGVGVDPVAIHVSRAHKAIAGADLGARVQVREGLMEELPEDLGSFDFIWCRDVVEGVAALDPFMVRAHRFLEPSGRMLVYTVFCSDLMSSSERDMMGRMLGNVPRNLIEANVEDSFARASFAIERKDVIGSEWREHAEENEGGVSQSLLRLSRLRRQREELVERFGSDVVDHVEANLHWLPYLILGKLVPTVYILRPLT